MMGKHLRCDFSMGIKEMLEDVVYGLLGEFFVSINQGSDVLRFGS